MPHVSLNRAELLLGTEINFLLLGIQISIMPAVRAFFVPPIFWPHLQKASRPQEIGRILSFNLIQFLIDRYRAKRRTSVTTYWYHILCCHVVWIVHRPTHVFQHQLQIKITHFITDTNSWNQQSIDNKYSNGQMNVYMPPLRQSVYVTETLIW